MTRAALMLIIGFGPACAVMAEKEVDEVEAPGIVESNNRFALDLYRHLRSKEGNLVVSPTSIALALSMAYAGAAGETESEMAATLHFKGPSARSHQQMKSLRDSFEAQRGRADGIQLRIANRLWAHDSYEFLPEFMELTREKYGAESARLDFGQSEQARQTINNWVKQQTEAKIAELIPKGFVSDDTKLVLTNAVYFRGDWQSRFDDASTRLASFYAPRGDKTTVPMMNRLGVFRYGVSRDDNLQVLEVPYAEKRLSMVVILPGQRDGLDQIESKLTVENLRRWTKPLAAEYGSDVDVYLPKFKYDSAFVDLEQALGKMGMESAFVPSKADFSRMTGSKSLFLSKVIHKAYVDVNEEGTEAAAATAIVPAPAASADGGGGGGPPVFRADHPFLYLIRDNRTDLILFLGRVNKPGGYRAGDAAGRKREAKTAKRGNVTGRINTRTTLRGKLTLLPARDGVKLTAREVEIGSAKPSFRFENVPDGVYHLQFRGTSDGTIRPLTWKGLTIDKPDEDRLLEIKAASRE